MDCSLCECHGRKELLLNGIFLALHIFWIPQHSILYLINLPWMAVCLAPANLFAFCSLIHPFIFFHVIIIKSWFCVTPPIRSNTHILLLEFSTFYSRPATISSLLVSLVSSLCKSLYKSAIPATDIRRIAFYLSRALGLKFSKTSF